MSTSRARWAGSPACFPVRLDPGALDLDEALAGGPALGRALKIIKEQLRALPDNGLGYGLLRYLNRADRGGSSPVLRRRSLASTIWVALRLRRQRTGPGAGGRRRSAAAAIPRCRWRMRSRSMRSRWMAPTAPTLQRDLVLGAGAADGGGGSRSGARAGSRRWRRWCAMRPARSRRPHARPICRWSRSRRPRSSGWRRAIRELEDILPLSPLQEGLLFHALYDAQGPDVYTVQLVLDLEGPLDGARAGGGGGGAAGSAMPACAPASSMRI